MEINLKRQLTQFEWLQLPPKAKELFKETFNIKRTGGSIVVDNRLISDGHTNDDLSVVSLKTLQEYLGTTEDHWDKILQLTINKMENPNADKDPISGFESGTVSKSRRSSKVKKSI